MNLSKKTGFVVFAGLFSALAVILYFIEIPVVPPFNYLKIDLSDIPAAFAACILGPAAGAAVELVKNLIHLAVRGFADTMGYGDLMNFLVGCAYTVSFSLLFRKLRKRMKNRLAPVLIGGAAGLILTVAIGIAGNYLLAPLYFRAFLHVALTPAELWAAIGGATVLNILKPVIATFFIALTAPFFKRFLDGKAF